MFIFILFVFGLISMFIPLIIKQGQNLSLLDINQLEYNIENLLGQVNAYFAEKGINILVISTSEIKISVLIEEQYTELALRTLVKILWKATS